MSRSVSYSVVSLAFFAFSLGASNLSVNLTTSVASPQPVGTSIGLSATVVGDATPNPFYVYSYSIAAPGGPAQVRRGFARSADWTWTPSAFEGVFRITVTVKNINNGTFGNKTILYTLTSRLAGGGEAVNPTRHPLVALFTGPACQTTNQMRVRFTPLSVPAGGIPGSMTTNLIPCRYDVTSPTPNATSMNFYIAGMYPNRTYNMHWEVLTAAGALLRTGADIQFTAGSLPANLRLPQFSGIGTPGAPERITVHSVVTIPVNGVIYQSSGVDTAGNVLWFGTNVQPIRMQPGGNYWGTIPGTDDWVQGIREVDPAGNAVTETTVAAVNEQLVAMGKQKITSFHHEIRRMFGPTSAPPTGHLLTIGSVDIASTNAQGGTPANPVAILGDMILVLDSNFNVKWTWNGFDFLDVNVPAIFDEKCSNPPGAGCPPFDTSFATGNDWMHSNSLQYTAYDGNIIMSMRHLDDVIKVNYAHGTGDGRVLWKLGHGPTKGKGGVPIPNIQMFTNNTMGGHDVNFPSFSHQHDAEVELGGQVIGGARILTVFDNGNFRRDTFNPSARSRCQVFALFEDSLVANLNRNVDVGSYSFAVGSAELLPNGNTVCDSGFIGGIPAATTNPRTETTESNAAGFVIHTLAALQDSYRTFRMLNLYTPVLP